MRINLDQAKQIVEYLDGHGGEFELTECDGHSGRGLYLYDPEYPEEGSIFLDTQSSLVSA